MKSLALAIRFLCEIAAVVAIVWWAWFWLGVVEGAAVIVIWGAWVAPKARWRLADPLRLAVELAIFTVATLGYAHVGQRVLALVFVCAAAATAFASRRLEA